MVTEPDSPTLDLQAAKSVYDRVGADKADNGVIDDNAMGTKRRGYLTFERKHPDVGQITAW
jgi:Family of unknown function (DUF6384)